MQPPHMISPASDTLKLSLSLSTQAHKRERESERERARERVELTGKTPARVHEDDTVRSNNGIKHFQD